MWRQVNRDNNKANRRSEPMGRNDRQLTWSQLCSLNRKLLGQLSELRPNQIDRRIQKAVYDEAVGDLFELTDGRCELTPANYIDTLKKLLYAEEFYESIEMRHHDQNNRILHLDEKGLARIRLHGLSKGQPSLIPKDLVVLQNGGRLEICLIVRLEGDDIFFARPKRMHIDNDYRFKVAFVSSGQIYERYHSVLDDLLRRPSLIRLSFFDEGHLHVLDEVVKESIIELETTRGNAILDERLAKCNERQRQAIVGILQAKCRPRPYILFGPPGTGKSFTLLEAVVQVCGRDPWLRLLVCANSNNCADQLAGALQRQPNTEGRQWCIRLSSQAHYDSGQANGVRCIVLKSLHEIGVHEYRIIVTTNNMAAGIRGHRFDYVLVDEAGHGHEAEILVPASLVGYDGLLVLAGDPKQLGPVIHCQQVERLGLGQSMLERMFKFRVYSCHPDKGYDNNYITKLTDCYRSDPRVLKLCNKLFYHDELRCLGKTPPSLMRQLDVGHPLLFCLVNGSEDGIQSSTSIMNKIEAQRCVDIIMHFHKIGIDPEKIGVISFYSLQKSLIRRLLKDRLRSELAKIKESIKKSAKNGENFDYLTIKAKSKPRPTHIAESDDTDHLRIPVNSDNNKRADDGIRIPSDWICKVDTVDGFQGNEREIIIISTVRCSGSSSGRIERCGFLADCKRFNVAFSRAKWLTLVVGHPAVLDCHDNWKEFK